MEPPPVAFAYDLDSLFRSRQANDPAALAADRAQAANILAADFATGTVSQADGDYLADLVASRTGLSLAEAGNRVEAVVVREQALRASLKAVAEQTRKAAASLAIFTALSMVIGAFIACISAALGGQQRDLHP